MATRGFEFAYNLDGSTLTPTIRDMTLGVAAAHKVGDLMLQQSDGYADQVTTTVTEVTGVMMEALAAADITAGTTKGKMAIITRNQVWRCSMDAATTTHVVGYTKTIDTVDCNTVSASDATGGAMCLLGTEGLDSDGNLIGYFIFLDTTFGNT